MCPKKITLAIALALAFAPEESGGCPGTGQRAWHLAKQGRTVTVFSIF